MLISCLRPHSLRYDRYASGRLEHDNLYAARRKRGRVDAKTRGTEMGEAVVDIWGITQTKNRRVKLIVIRPSSQTRLFGGTV